MLHEIKKRSDGSHYHGREKKNSLLHVPEVTKDMPVKSFSGNFQYPYTFSGQEDQKDSLEGKHKERAKVAKDDTEHTIRTADKRILPCKLIWTPL